MGLTVKMQQMLEGYGLDALFDEHREQWKEAAKRTHTFVTLSFPDESTIRRDDVAESMVSMLEVNEELQGALAVKKLKQKYWATYFAHYIVDKLWDEIS
ncbi:MAG: hypothetical protein NW206_05090 [Hyphomonadaceae bacterium]|nr:hypothetical protein [Hyphomonadaceae bacterium]